MHFATEYRVLCTSHNAHKKKKKQLEGQISVREKTSMWLGPEANGI
jgi:hypothetical protein